MRITFTGLSTVDLDKVFRNKLSLSNLSSGSPRSHDFTLCDILTDLQGR